MSAIDDMSGGPMSGKRCLITGATNGIGRETALGLARLGAEVVIVGRDSGRIDATLAQLRDTAGSASASAIVADLSSLRQVRQAAGEFRARFDRLDVLVNNAGVWRTSRELTEDGFETMFAVNHLAYFALTALLLETLKASAPARIINVASAAHKGKTIDFDDLQGERRFGGFGRYGQSKLANIMFTYELSRRLEGTGVTANCLHPGFVGSGFGGGNPGIAGRAMGVAMRVVRPIAKSPAKGARTSIYLASAPELGDVSGRYFSDCEEAQSSPESHDTEAQGRLWEISERLCGLGV